MKQELIADLQYQFNLIAHNTDDKNVEFWYARDLQIILGYDKWENFFRVIEKAKISCENSQIEISDHFLDVRKMVEIGVVLMIKALDTFAQRVIMHCLGVLIRKR